jgi:hypothetical protein
VKLEKSECKKYQVGRMTKGKRPANKRDVTNVSSHIIIAPGNLRDWGKVNTSRFFFFISYTTQAENDQK